MATFHIIGDTLVEPHELMFKNVSGELQKAQAANQQGASNISLAFNNGSVQLGNLAATQQAKGFDPIGIGKPLSVEIMTVYTGNYKSFFGGKKDMIVVSGVKNAQTYDAASRAVNKVQPKADRHNFPGFGALTDGTPMVYYTPAMDSETMSISFEIMYDNFDTTLLDTLSSLLAAGAGFPVFLTVAPYLLGASQVIKLAGNLGNTLFAGSPALSGTIEVRFMSPIIPDTEAREFVIYDDNDKNEFANLKAEVVLVGGNNQLRLVDKTTGDEYSGDAPYLIVILNGALRTDLTNFAPKIASAALLKQFYGADNKAAEVTTVLESAMELYNDSSYKAKGDALKKQLDQLTKGSDQYNNLKVLYDAYKGNIKSDEFKLPELT